MKVLCKLNNLKYFSDEDLLVRLTQYIRMPDGEINLTIGKEYTVYGMVFRDNSPWYYLCSEDYDEYPTPFPSECFDITDKRLSSYWNLLTREIGNGKIQSSLVIPEWAEDPYFYELLLDGDIDTVELFNRYKKLLDQE